MTCVNQCQLARVPNGARSVSSSRRGATLLELSVVMTIVAVGAAIVAMSWSAFSRHGIDTSPPPMESARARAIASGRAVTVEVVHDGRPRFLTAFPDGSIVADPDLGIDRLTGRTVRAAPR